MGVGLGRDLRYVVRTLSRSRAFSLVTIAIMALGVGATTTFFSLAYGVLVRPLPWPEPDRIVRLQEWRGGNRGRIPWTISNTTYHAWREAPETVEDIGGWMRTQPMTLTAGSGEPERVRVGRVTTSLFRVLWVHPATGRPFADEDAGSDGPHAVLLGYRLWQRRFGGAEDVVGRTIRLDDRPVVVAGVMPRDFTFPDREAEAWLPLQVARVEAGAGVIRAMIFNAVARIRPGVTPEQAAGEGTSRGRAAPKLGLAAVALFGSDGEVAVSATPARAALTDDVRPALVILLGAVVLLFCAALASVLVLQSSRAVRRRREMAVRAAIGASRTDLVRQWIVESAVLAVAGGLAGLLVAALLHQLLPALLPPDFPRAEDVRLDGAVMLFGLATGLVAGVASGLAPALQIRQNLPEALSSDSTMAGASSAGRRAGRIRATMMMLQVAIACVLLVGTGLLARSFAALVSADRGFDPHDVLTAHLTIRPRPFAAGAAALERAQARLRSLPGVTHVAFGNALPYVTTGGFRGLTLPSPGDPGVKLQAQTIMRTVHPEYFDALRLRVVAGRALDRRDTSSSRPVVVVNRTFAARYVGADPVGRILTFVAGSRREWEVVGVVDDVRQGGLTGVAPGVFGGLTDPPQPELFFTHAQWDTSVSDLVFVIRSAADPSMLAPALRAILHDEDPSIAIDSIATMEERLLNSLARPRTYAVLIGGFGLFALLVAAVGLFGTVSYLIAQRTREFGVRTALGARPGDILALVMRGALTIALSGIAAGTLGAVLLARSLRSLIYGVSPHDPVSFLAVPLLLFLVVALASAGPARRATRVSPLVALRTE
ncbi:MAG TPA: ABC transporter permease [Vicinamibacterales bacterium]|nr:ABC transporter permease [Vicinamibacterales bacterium]